MYGSRQRDPRHEVAPVEGGRFARLAAQRVLVLLRRVRREHPVLEAVVADPPHQRARVDAADRRHALALRGSACSDSDARQLLGASKNSFTTKPERKGRADSMSRALVPTLPICG